MQPPKEELAKLRKVTESPEDQYRREQAALAAALDEFLAEHGTPTQAQPDHAPNRRRRGDRGRNAERAERALEAEVEQEKKKPATGPATIAMARASSPFPWRQSSRAWRPKRRRHSIRRRRPPPPPEQPEPEQVQSPSPPGKAQPDQTWGGEKGPFSLA